MNTEYKLVKVKDRNIVTIGEHFTVNRTSEVQAPGNFLENVLQFNPSLPVYTTTGEFAGPVGGYPDRENPLARLERNKDNRYTYWRMFGDAYININPLKDLRALDEVDVEPRCHLQLREGQAPCRRHGRYRAQPRGRYVVQR